MRRILFVDDEPRVLRGLQNALRQERRVWDMVFVGSGEEALAALAASPFEVLVTDIRMPDMDGVALLHAVNTRYPAVRCLALSGYAEYEKLQAAESIVLRFLLKPCDTDELRAAIRAALDPVEPAVSSPAGRA
jgi:YesN/AraC family two-component response regulator